MTPIPGPFFTQLLPEIDNLVELKVTLYTFWRLDRMESKFRYLQMKDYLGDVNFTKGLGESDEQMQATLQEGLQRAVTRGTLIQVDVEIGGEPETLYFLNSPRGRAAIEAIQQGNWQPRGDPRLDPEPRRPPPNIFRLYEENIGPLTPLIAESLQEAESSYPLAWIEEAIQIAVENNVRRWRYVEAILRTWQEEGRDEGPAQRDSQEDRHRYVRGRFAEFIEH